ncbi:hypothetical protein A2W39_02525 [Candidatus Azambacteria bacterium RIFCSPHIGHO2_01_46_10]|uniref:Rubrerythrin rubredoxin-like domain-containing protein n=3 Tax=Candidatus Azamiibacteriota TaxID=1752741 RepID=A0A1F5C8K1_9BACT|nr:MAG: hypothetical protein A2W39_02525 [Candidatus Azambacteria bacterium RIFCSPHIGHO2_01_46_10]OGD39164.1 MAG: hypothetical protein A3A25_01395 [Candidatus Azambacteria bacterium RIFCSPLOWO2_01_FULL_46_26]OGD44113.1 MAG: hypothetical protein A3J02_01595 [Candidatus Azambacteria bacterium RIFCSPLOWO2_02_FULL_46_11]
MFAKILLQAVFLWYDGFMKKYWKCTVCGDIHWGVRPSHECPTCRAADAYIEISKEEAEKILFSSK